MPLLSLRHLGGVSLLLASFTACPLFAGAAEATGWDEEAQIVQRIHAPSFPDRTFVITDFGATAGADSTAAIAKAIETCHAQGGGHVVVPKGVFLTGAVHLLSHVDLHVSEGATLKFLTDPAAYLPVVFTRWEGVECMNYSPFIYAFNQEDIGVTGTGTLDGSASDQVWWGWARKGQGKKPIAAADSKALNELADKGVAPEARVFGAGHYLRPNFVQPYRCRNVIVDGLTIVNSPMWEINPVLCTNVIVRNLKISTIGPNNDGCDPESSRDVLIEHCIFNTGDDCIAIKSGRNDDGRRVGVPAENLVIRGCSMRDGHAGVAIGSEISGGCRNVFIEDCTMDSPHLDRALRLKSNAKRGGVIENIYMHRTEVGQVNESLLTVDFQYEEGPHGAFMPTVRNVQIDHVNVKGSPRIFYIAGIEGGTIDQIRVSNSSLSGLTSPEYVVHAGQVLLDHVQVIPAKVAHGLNSREQP